MLPIAVGAALAALVACGNGAGSGRTDRTTPAPMLEAGGCEPRPSAGVGPVTDPNGPYYHRVVVAHTTDGVTLTGARQVLEHASVPDGVRLADGSVLVYYVNGEDGATWVARLEGDEARPIGPVSLNGIERPGGMVDPDATLLSGGTVRLAYFGSFGPPVPGASQSASMCLADSSDGVHFALVGEAIAFPVLTTDPSLLRLRDGSWLMAVSQGQRTVLARSRDGLRFERYAVFDGGGVPELAGMDGGKVRLYVCARGIESYVSDDRGVTWEREATVATGSGSPRIVCDPSRVAGTDLFIYKTAD